MRWILPTEDHARAHVLSRELSLHPVSAQVLVARGYDTPQAAADLLRDRLADLPDPAGLKGMAPAVERLVRAIGRREKLTLYGDYDVDGVTSTSLLAGFLGAAGANVSTYIPLRLEEGYGLNPEAVEHLAADGTRLLVCLDCGISAVDEIARANELGMEVIVIDHHQPGPTLPAAHAVIDPHQPGCTYPGRQLCAAGLAFLVAVALRRALREAGAFLHRAEPNLREYLDLAALGTIADVVPLVGINRILVKHGLAEIARARRPGIRALKTTAGLGATAELTSGQIGFRIAPRINAAGRIADANAGVRLLTTGDEAEALRIAQQLDQANTERQAIERRILDEAIAQAEQLGGSERHALVVASEGWHPGVVGIVASRLVERFHRPSFVVALEAGAGRGSGRSIEGFHLFQALQRCAEHLTRYGGHKHAAGLSLSQSALPTFREALEGLARATLSPEDLERRFRIDALVRPAELDLATAEALQALGPFGAGNPEPVLAGFGLRARPRVLAAKNGGPGHLKLSLAEAAHLDVIGFGLAEHAALTAAPLDAAFHLGVDEWNGNRRLGLRLKDLRASSS